MVSDQVLNGAPTLERLNRLNRVKKRGGRYIVEPIAKALPSGGSYAGAEPFDLADNDELEETQWLWKQYRRTPFITGIDDAINDGEAAVISIWRSKMELAAAGIADDLATDMFQLGNQTVTTAITTLEQIADDGNTYTVGGKTSDDVALWQGNVVSNSGSAFDIADLETLVQQCSPGALNIRPTDVVCDDSGFVKLWSAFTTLQRFVKGDDTYGFDNMKFDTAIVYKDKHVQSTNDNFTGLRMFVLNLNYLRFNILSPKGDFAFREIEPTTVDGYGGLLKLYCQLTCNSRRYQGVYHNFV